MHTPVGTLEYAAPEMLDGRDQPYNEMCDMWSIGVIAYTLLTDARPFAHVDEAGKGQGESAAVYGDGRGAFGGGFSGFQPGD